MFSTPLVYRTGGITGTRRELTPTYCLRRERKLWLTFRFCDYFVSTADGTPVRLYFRRMGVRASRLRVWPNAFRPMSERVFERKNRILYLGRIDKIKAIEYIIEAFTRALPHLPADYKLIICGARERPTPFERELKETVARSKHADRVEFHPWTRDAEACYKQARMVVTGCANNQIMEAYACGTPVIALDLGETKDLYGHLQGVHIVDYPEGGYLLERDVHCLLPECYEQVTTDTVRLILQLAKQKEYPVPTIDFACLGWEQRLQKEADWYEEMVRSRRCGRGE